MAPNKKTPAWVWIGCGCGLLVLLVVGLLGGAGFWGWSQLSSMVDDMADPLARDEAAMRMLGAEKLPEGWHAHVFFQIPIIMKLAMLTDGELGEAIEGGFEEKAQALENMRLRREDMDRNFFLYFKIKGRGDESVEDLLVGHRGGGDGRRTETQMDLDIEIEPGEPLNEGTLEIGQQIIEWRAQTGVMEVVGGSLEGIYTAATIRCSADTEIRDALWFQAYESTDGEGEQASAGETTAAAETTVAAETASAGESTAGDTAGGEAGPDSELPEIDGTPADPAALEWLFGHFELCG